MISMVCFTKIVPVCSRKSQAGVCVGGGGAVRFSTENVRASNFGFLGHYELFASLFLSSRFREFCCVVRIRELMIVRLSVSHGTSRLASVYEVSIECE